jgi:hypothetical protein
MATPLGFADVSLTLKHDADPEPWFVTYGVETDLGAFSAVEHANQQQLAFAEPWAFQLSDEVTIGPAICRFGQDGGPDLIVESDLTPVRGTSTTEKLPQNCAALIRKNTGLGGRPNRGRCYLPGVLSEGGVNQVGAVETATVTDFQTRADDWLEALALGATGSSPLVPTPMVILHGPSSAGPAGPPTPVISLTMGTRIATQRRRLR